MKRSNLFKYGLTALMMAFAMTLCYSCSSDDDEETNQEVNPPSNGESKISGTINGHDYVVLVGTKWATKNVEKVPWQVGILPSATDATYGYGYYYSQANAITAAASWGGTWQLPTKAQWSALMDDNNCTWEWKTNYNFGGKTGYLVTDNGNGNSIFLPAAGVYDIGYRMLFDQGHIGYYWSTVEKSYLDFDYECYRIHEEDPLWGMAVRPVAN